MSLSIAAAMAAALSGPNVPLIDIAPPPAPEFPRKKKSKQQEPETLEQRRSRRRRERDARLKKNDLRDDVRGVQRAQAEAEIPDKYLHSAARRRRQAEREGK